MLEEDALLTFTQNDVDLHNQGTIISINYADDNRQGNITFLKASDQDGDLQNTVNRIQLAKGTYGIYISRGANKILVNAYGLTMQGKTLQFKDVPPTHFVYQYIQILASNGITIGYKGNFDPNQAVSREHFAVFLSRLQ